MKHTPGPWEVRTIDGSLGTIDSQNGFTVAQTMQLRGNDRDTDHAERKANARLIAAAPELLNALELLLKKAEHIYSQLYYAEPSSKNDVTFNAARAAIAKATQP